jgi:DNA-binding LytR/AlgR family response regulator
MGKYKYIIVDDDYPSHLAVIHHLSKHTNYQCVTRFYNPLKALEFLEEQEVDLIFLDIEMQEMSGFQFLEQFHKNVFVVFLTAYPDKYAETAHQYYFDKELVVFCNKSQFAYFLPKIIARFEKLNQEKAVLDRIHKLYKNEVHTFPKTFNNKSLLLSDILFIEVIGHNCILKTKYKEELVCRMTMSELTNVLPAHIFFQITRSVIINIVHATAFTNSSICVVDQHFSISFNKRKKVVQALQMHKEELYKIYD